MKKLMGLLSIVSGVVSGVLGLLLTFGYLLEHSGVSSSYLGIILLFWLAAVTLLVIGIRLRHTR